MEPQVFRLPQRVLDRRRLRRSAARSKIVRGHGRDRNPIVLGHLVGRQDGEVAADRPRERLLLGVVTSIARSTVARIPQSAAAERWLSTAPGPQNSTAAIHRASRESTRCPTA